MAGPALAKQQNFLGTLPLENDGNQLVAQIVRVRTRPPAAEAGCLVQIIPVCRVQIITNETYRVVPDVHGPLPPKQQVSVVEFG